MRKLYLLVVDDSRLMRRLIGDILAEMQIVARVAFAPDAQAAGKLLAEEKPDVITLDIEMPDMDGIAFLEQLMARNPLPVVMVSALTSRGAEATLTALEKGAVDVVAKPTGLDGMRAFRADLAAAVSFAASAQVDRMSNVDTEPVPAPRRALMEPELIGIAASTGGVSALASVLPALPENCPPVLVTQHMPAAFVERLARRLRGRLDRDIAVAQDGEVLRRNMIRFAPGHRHLVPKSSYNGLSCSLSDAAAPMGHTPSADLMFGGMARLGRPTIGIILTGMGRDGAQGLAQLREAGSVTIGQDQSSCVVYGMPRAAFEIGALDEVLPLAEIGARISIFWQPSLGKVAG
ncbi:two-component system, chemotaxis family, response regulator CheB [Monaibacterium marinum]|uniref:Protein-glutamate methylesterase/protein-glutamine glutaminase n=1 Tax=Pontivivens marinum TaxID=1690039 RepID=A0A2C9CNC7_9RHOB|nr:chemotaxis-specific protein-glutamate methyltransferase CheB [Monaibacterium marinum]SOH92753.1 two-component system, chemotaxis family, response regulator CheB [Monaibacterium marinum]